MLIISLALYNSVVTPLDFSFNYIMDKQGVSPFYEIDFVINFIYLIDIVFGFITSYIN